ncbi:E3 SUMO-protein ligase PIAS3 [Galdieria sulphuraria]|nr:E3 SUMO-protein ligase PIAS3 [Galdieria sulphuraria]
MTSHMTSPGERFSNLSDVADAIQALAAICGYHPPGDTSDFEDFLKEIRQLTVEWNSEERNEKLSFLLQHRKTVLVFIASSLGLKRSGTKAALADSIISRLSVSHQQVNPNTTGVSHSAFKSSSTLPSVRVVCGEVLYLHKKTESTGIVFGEVEKTILSYPFTQVENQFMRILGPPLNDGKGLAWFSSVALEIGAKSVPIYFTVTHNWKESCIVLRCLRVDLSVPLHMWKNEWPFPVVAQVNGYQMKLKTATRYTNGKIFGVDGATDISDYVRKDSSSNKVVLYRPSSTSDHSNVKVEYILFAQPAYIYSDGDIVNNISSNSWSRFLQRIRHMGSVPYIDYTKVSKLEWFQLYIINYMAAEELELEQFQVSLRCPLSLIPLKLPALSVFCKHMQCFDLSAFLSFTRNNLRFLCPICSICVCWDELLICPFILEMISTCPDSKALTICSDGSFQVIKEENEEELLFSNHHNNNNNNNSCHNSTRNHSLVEDIIDLSDDEE